MSEFVQQHDHEKGQVFQRIPGDRGVVPVPALYFVDRDEKPRPVQKDVNACELEEAYGTLAASGHLLEVYRMKETVDGRGQISECQFALQIPRRPHRASAATDDSE